MRIFSYVLAILLCGAVNANAQTFAADSGISDSAKSPDENVVAAPVAQNEPQEQAKNAASVDEPLQDAVVNIGGKSKDSGKKYDNSIGRVVEYKIVNGELVFPEDTERKVLVYYENYKADKGMDNLVRCSMRIYVLNDLTERINNLSFRLIWPEISTTIQMVRVNPGVRTYQDIMLLGDGCFSMDKTPTLEINRCRVKGKTEEQCANAVKWFKNGK